jgi:hypothetical protein
MALEGFIPEIWSGQLEENLRRSHVFAAVCNNNYEGEIADFGDAVRINQIGTITVSDYSPDSTTITPQKISDAQKQLKIDQAKYFAFEVDDVRRTQMKPKIMQGAMREAGWSLRDAMDQFIAGKYTDAAIVSGLGTEATAIDITSVNVTEYVGLCAQKLNEANVPLETRWMILPPWFHQKLVLAKITLDTSNSSIISEGFVGRYLGFNLFMSNNVSVKTAATNQGSRIMFGYSGSITLAEQLVKMEAFRPESSFHDAVKGLHIYGAKVVRPDATGVLIADYTAEP